MSTYIKLLPGVYGSYTTYCYMTARRIYICFRSPGSIHVVPITGTKRFLLTDACAADQFYFTTLVWTREIFPVKQIAHVAIAKTYTWMKARDVKKENQMKSKLLRGNLFTWKDEVCKHKYKIFICCSHEIRL